MSKKDQRYSSGRILELICPICHKKFIPAPMHMYREAPKGKKVCSYKCRCEAERRRNDTERVSNTRVQN